MKKLTWIFIILTFFIVGGALAKSKATNTPTPSPSITPIPKPNWVPPPHVDNDSKAVNATVAANYSSDVSGGYGLLDLSTIRKLDENDVSAMGTVRFTKGFSSSDNGA